MKYQQQKRRTEDACKKPRFAHGYETTTLVREGCSGRRRPDEA